MNTPSSKLVVIGLFAAVVALATTHASAQHQGHTMPMPAPAPAAKPAQKPAPKAAAKKPVAKPAVRPSAKTPTAVIDHAAMGHGPAPTAKASPKPARATANPAPKKPEATRPRTPVKPPVAPTVVDHAAMGHDVPAAAASAAMDHAGMAMDGMEHSAMPGMDHAAMGGGPDADLPADAAPRTPIPAVTDADRAAAIPPASGHAVHDRSINSYWLVDRLEWQDTDAGAIGWEGLAWIGGDTNRVWLRSEGEAEDGDDESADLEVLFGRSVSPWWDAVAGVRQDFGHGPSRTWAAFGFQGLAPYKFEVEATAYVGGNGRTAATLEAEYDTLLTNRLVLQWRGEANLYGKDDPAVGVGSGLSTIEAGARLRYEFSRRFAPYVGIEFERAFGDTADYRRLDDESARDTRLVAGIRLWF